MCLSILAKSWVMLGLSVSMAQPPSHWPFILRAGEISRGAGWEPAAMNIHWVFVICSILSMSIVPTAAGSSGRSPVNWAIMQPLPGPDVVDQSPVISAIWFSVRVCGMAQTRPPRVDLLQESFVTRLSSFAMAWPVRMVSH
jgi:hypothetical protein